jgi:hypothetical protein
MHVGSEDQDGKRSGLGSAAQSATARLLLDLLCGFLTYYYERRKARLRDQEKEQRSNL